jgi:capsule polysaccharide export protein KpsE/RkpR
MDQLTLSQQEVRNCIRRLFRQNPADLTSTDPAVLEAAIARLDNQILETEEKVDDLAHTPCPPANRQLTLADREQIEADASASARSDRRVTSLRDRLTKTQEQLAAVRSTGKPDVPIIPRLAAEAETLTNELETTTASIVRERKQALIERAALQHAEEVSETNDGRKQMLERSKSDLKRLAERRQGYARRLAKQREIIRANPL